MAAEKLCKAYLYSLGVEVGFTHAVVKKHLPTVLMKGPDPQLKQSASKMTRLKQLANHIELLAPALSQRGANPENAEYPWANAKGEPISPLVHKFPLLQNERELTTLLRNIRKAAKTYVAA